MERFVLVFRSDLGKLSVWSLQPGYAFVDEVMDANLQSIQPVLYETDEDEFSRQPSVKTTTTCKQVKKKRSTVQGKIQDYKLAYFSLWWSRMFREGKKEEEAKKLEQEKKEALDALKSKQLNMGFFFRNFSEWNSQFQITVWSA